MTVTGDANDREPRSVDGDDAATPHVPRHADLTDEQLAATEPARPGWISEGPPFDQPVPASFADDADEEWANATWAHHPDVLTDAEPAAGTGEADDPAVALDPDAQPAAHDDDFIAETVTEEQPESEQQPSAFEEFAASWVPPWARSLPELLIEPASDYTPEELAVGRLAYADPDELPNPDEFEPGLGEIELRAALEAILMVVDEPVSVIMLAQVLEEPTGRVDATLHSLAAEYAAGGRGFDLRSVAGGWRFYTRGEYANYVERFVLDGQQIRLTQAALETLAVVAYKQPVSRSRVAAIRGVNCDGVMKTLVTRGLIEECGAEDNGAHLYRTTRLFLEKIGVNSVADLPSLGPFLPDNVNEMDFAQQ
jgi:segregation and condensation protein B